MRNRRTLAGAVHRTGAASLFRIHPKRGQLREFRDAYCSEEEAATLKELTRAFASRGILLPNGATACLSTPMGPAQIDHIVEAFEDYLATHGATYDGTA